MTAPVREAAWRPEERVLVVNQGMHGLAWYRLDEAGLTHLGGMKCPGAVDRMAVSRPAPYVAVTEKGAPGVHLCRWDA